jgi:hypothetical protein
LIQQLDNLLVSGRHSALSATGVEMIFGGNSGGQMRSRSSFEARKRAPQDNGSV